MHIFQRRYPRDSWRGCGLQTVGADALSSSRPRADLGPRFSPGQVHAWLLKRGVAPAECAERAKRHNESASRATSTSIDGAPKHKILSTNCDTTVPDAPAASKAGALTSIARNPSLRPPLRSDPHRAQTPIARTPIAWTPMHRSGRPRCSYPIAQVPSLGPNRSDTHRSEPLRSDPHRRRAPIAQATIAQTPLLGPPFTSLGRPRRSDPIARTLSLGPNCGRPCMCVCICVLRETKTLKLGVVRVVL